MIIKLFITIVTALLLFDTSLFADKLEDIKKSGIMKVGLKVNAKPFSYKSRSGRLIGFEVDLIKKMAKILKVKVKFVEVTSKNRFQYVIEDKVDISLATATHTVKRDVNVDFSISYFYDGQAIVARADLVAGSYKDFNGKTIAAVEGSTSGAVFEVIQPLCKVIYFKTMGDAIQAIYDKKADAATSDFGLLFAHYKASKGKLKMVGKKFTLEPYGMSMKENESNFRDEINFALQTVVKNGDYVKLHKKWFLVGPSRKPTLWP